MMRLFLALAILAVAHVVAAQPTPLPNDDPKLQYEVVSIKKNTSGSLGSSGRSLDDGTEIAVNGTVRGFLDDASPVPVRDVVGFPGWVTSERYDITLKPPAGSTKEQRAAMLRNMLRERMKFAAHVEEREQQAFALVVARPDGKLGPELTPSTLNCGQRSAGPPPPPPPPGQRNAQSYQDMRTVCGVMIGTGRVVSGGMLLDRFVDTLGTMAGGFVTNRTGLTGYYAISLTYTPSGTRAGGIEPGDPPELTTAIQEQLGLKLVPERMKVRVLVVDHIEPPSAN